MASLPEEIYKKKKQHTHTYIIYSRRKKKKKKSNNASLTYKVEFQCNYAYVSLPPPATLSCLCKKCVYLPTFSPLWSYCSSTSLVCVGERQLQDRRESIDNDPGPRSLWVTSLLPRFPPFPCSQNSLAWDHVSGLKIHFFFLHRLDRIGSRRWTIVSMVRIPL